LAGTFGFGTSAVSHSDHGIRVSAHIHHSSGRCWRIPARQNAPSSAKISPLVTGPWDIGPNPGAATFYPYLPDLSIAQRMFLTALTIAVLAAVMLPGGTGGRSLRAAAAAVTAAGLLAAGTAVALAGTGRLDAHGMIAIPALHDAANDRPLRYTPVCS